MNRYLNRYVHIVIAAAVCFALSCCGVEEPTPTPTPTPTPAPDPGPTPITNVQEINKSAITVNTENKKMFVAVEEQSGGRAVLSGSIVDTKASSTINIIGVYDSEGNRYVFDLSGLEVGKTYRYQVTIYNASGQKVMESAELTVTLPESDSTPDPDVQEISESSIKPNTEKLRVLVTIEEQEGGKVVMKVTKASSQIQIDGTYDKESGAYLFDLSNLEKDNTYQYIISVYNKEGKKVMESKSKSITIPESADIDKDGSDGGADGTRGR